MREEWWTAAVGNDCRALARLVTEGVPIDCLDRYGQTALMLAAHRGNADAVALLINHGAEMNVTAKYGLSALMLAVVNRHVETAKLLINAGADTHIRGSGVPGFAGKTAGDLAVELNLGGLTTLIGQGDA